MASELCVHRILPDDSIAYWQVFLFLARTAAGHTANTGAIHSNLLLHGGW